MVGQGLGALEGLVTQRAVEVISDELLFFFFMSSPLGSLADPFSFLRIQSRLQPLLLYLLTPVSYNAMR